MLKEKIKNHSAKICIIGLGYVGLPLAVEFAKKGFRVFGIDTDRERIKNVNSGRNYIRDIDSKEFKHLSLRKRIIATDDYSVLKEVDVIIICVPTPLRKTMIPDISYIIKATNMISKYLRKGQLVILESTTYPGTTREVVLPALERKGLRVGKDFYLAFSPERVDPANKVYKVRNTPKIVGGMTDKCNILAESVYSRIVEKVVPVSSPEIAEMAKLLENTFRMVNIALVNEVALMCNRLNLNVWEVIDGAATKPFGFMPFYPGPGLGGHCIPVDPHYLSWKMRKLNFRSKFIDLATEINSRMPEFVIEKMRSLLKKKSKSLKNSKILVLGVTYKANVSDMRESPALDILKLLLARGTKVYFNDPYVSKVSVNGKILSSVSLKNISRYDCVLVVSPHKIYNFNDIVSKAKLVFDTRNAIKGVSSSKVISL